MAEIEERTLEGPFHLERGGILPGVRVAYSILGEPAPDHSNVVWVCHALTSNADPESWWEGLIGTGYHFDPQKDCIICANILGSCYGTTGPLDQDPVSGQAWFDRFPEVTVKDIVKVLDLLRQDLGIERIGTLIGGSLGGQQALEWAIERPELIDELVLLATNAQHSPWGIAFNETQRMAIKADRTYYSKDPKGGQKGLSAARAIALLSYRNYNTYEVTQQDERDVSAGKKRAATYQQYQGQKLVERFNAHSYVILSKAMDSHDVGRGRASIEAALATVKAKTLVIGVSSDLLFPTPEQRFLVEHIPNASYEEIDSLYGHDGFLIETEKITNTLSRFFDKNKNEKKRPEHEPIT